MQQTINFYKKLTQADRVLRHLMEHGKITNLQCHELYGIRHCPSVIRNLRKQLAKEGRYEIINERKNGCNRFGDKCVWDDYVLCETKKNTQINGNFQTISYEKVQNY